MPLLRPTALLLLLAAPLGLAACRREPVTEVTDTGAEVNLTPPAAGWRLLPGRIDVARSSVQAIASPPSVRAGETFTVTINTYGSSSCTRPNGHRLRVSGRTADITALDWEAPDDTPCTRDLRYFPHQIPLRFERAGDATLRVRARDPRGDEATYDVVVRVNP